MDTPKSGALLLVPHDTVVWGAVADSEFVKLNNCGINVFIHGRENLKTLRTAINLALGEDDEFK